MQTVLWWVFFSLGMSSSIMLFRCLLTISIKSEKKTTKTIGEFRLMIYSLCKSPKEKLIENHQRAQSVEIFKNRGYNIEAQTKNMHWLRIKIQIPQFFSILLSCSLWLYRPRCIFRRICIVFHHFLFAFVTFVHLFNVEFRKATSDPDLMHSKCYRTIWLKRMRVTLRMDCSISHSVLMTGARARTQQKEEIYVFAVRRNYSYGKNANKLIFHFKYAWHPLQPNYVHQFLLPDFYTENLQSFDRYYYSMSSVFTKCIHCSSSMRMRSRVTDSSVYREQ